MRLLVVSLTMTIRHLLIIVLCALWPTIGFSQDAGFVDGYQLIAFCEAAPDDAREMLCDSYVMGLVDGFQSLKLVCMPPEAIIKQATDVSLSYLRSHPDKRRYSAASVVGKALQDAFPCGTSARSGLTRATP